MNISHFGAINKSLQSHESTPQNNSYNEPSQRFQSMGLPMVNNGGMLKKSIRFDYEFSSPRKQPLDDSPPRVTSFLVPEKDRILEGPRASKKKS